MIALLFAAALVGVDKPIDSGADYLQACEGKDPRQRAACTGYFSGVVATAEAFHAQSAQAAGEVDSPFICAAEDGQDEREASLSVIRRDDGMRQVSAVVGILSGLLEAYPCSDSAAPETPAELVGGKDN